MKTEILETSKLITQSEYAKLKGLSRQRVNQMVKSRDLPTVEIKGAVLIKLD